MEKRIGLFVFLSAVILLVGQLLFPPPPPPEKAAPRPRVQASAPSAPRAAPATTAAAPVRDVTIPVRTELARYTLSTRGARITDAELTAFPSFLEKGENVQLIPRRADEFLAQRLVFGRDTVDLRTLGFEATAERAAAANAPQRVRFVHAGPVGVEMVYTFSPRSYFVDVEGRVTGRSGGVLLSTLGPGLAPHEADPERYTHDHAVAAFVAQDVESLTFDELEGPGTRIDGPMRWAAIHDKYFAAAVIAAAGQPEFTGLELRRLPPLRLPASDPGEEARTLPRASAVAALPLRPDGTFSLRLYLGPQEHAQMAAAGVGLENVTPYGYRWLRPVIGPIAAAALWVLNGLHEKLGVSYGWALVIFGILMRVLLWPLNARAMRAQMKNMEVQPLVQEIQQKYKNDPERLNQEMVKLWREKGFNPLAGCVPMLLPMPVFTALFFVFQNSIAFRGTAFGWLPDLSQKDPYYILPAAFVVTMVLTQWLGNRLSGIEPNAQMKMMMYVMPAMMAVFFANLASGLNLYYTASNIAGLPQQILISRERRRFRDAEKATARAEEAPRAALRPAPHRPAARKRK